MCFLFSTVLRRVFVGIARTPTAPPAGFSAEDHKRRRATSAANTTPRPGPPRTVMVRTPMKSSCFFGGGERGAALCLSNLDMEAASSEIKDDISSFGN